MNNEVMNKNAINRLFTVTAKKQKLKKKEGGGKA